MNLRLLIILVFMYAVPSWSQCFITGFSASLTACDPTDNSYSTSGTVSFSGAPATGTMTVTDCNGIQQTFFPPFSSPIAYNLTGQIADGAPCDITVEFSADPGCTATIPYTAPFCPCNMDSLVVSIGICDPFTDTYPITGHVVFTSPPTTGTLVIEVNNGTSTYDTIINLPFTSPMDFSFTGLVPSDGASTSITAYFSDDSGCSNTLIYTAPTSCYCAAEIGTFDISYSGGSPNPGVLCWGDSFLFTSNDDYTVPDPASSAFPSYDPGVGWLIYSCPPTVGLVPSTDPAEAVSLDPCLLGIINSEDITDINDPGIIGSYPAGTFTDNIVYYVPITMYSLADGYYSSTDTEWPCYEMGTPVAVQYLPEFTYSVTEDCNTHEATVTVNGGMPALDGTSLFTASGLTPSSAFFVNTTAPDGGTIVVGGLNGGDMYSFDVTDDNGCPYTVSGGPFPPLGDAGTNGTVSFCDTDPSANLFSSLGASPETGGSWSGPSVLGGGYLGTFNPATMTPGVYTYTAGSAPCDSSATVTVTVTPTANAGTNGSISFCDTDPSTNLFSSLGGSPDTGGSWSGPSALGGGYLGAFNPATMSAGVYTYNVGTVPCDASATVTVTITPTADAGTNGTISFCDTDAPSNLFGSLGGSPDAGGSWSGPSALGGGSLGTFDPSTMSAGVYTYNVGTIPCDASATVTVTVTPTADAGTDGTVSFCTSAPATNLFSSLGGSPDTGGSWSGPSVLGGGYLGTFNPATMAAGAYTYTAGMSPCDASATVTVTITPTADAGTNGTISYCDTDSPSDLFDALGGSPDAGGSWSGPSALGGGSLGTFNPATMTAGVYTYSVGSAPCDASATVTVTVTPTADAGTNGTVSYCESDPGGDLFASLGGTPDAGGSWSGPSILSGGSLGTFDPATMAAGIYTYHVGTAPCDASATVTVTINTLPSADFEFATYCLNDADPLPDFDVDDDLVDDGIGGVFSSSPAGLVINAATGLVDLSASTPGTYTITNTVSSAGCPDVSYDATITVFELPDATVLASENVCEGEPFSDIEIDLTAGTGPWTVNYQLDGTPLSEGSIASSPHFMPSGSGTYTFTSVTDANGCTNTLATVITKAYEDKPVVTPVSDLSVCDGNVLSVGGFSCDIPGSTFSWTNVTGTDIGFGLAGSGNIGTFTASGGTSVTTVMIEVVATSPAGCIGDPVTFTITVNPLPVVSFYGGPVAGCEPLQVTFYNTTSPAGTSCVWDFGDGTTGAGCDSVVHVYMHGVYDVSLTVTTSAGCTATTTYYSYINVEKLPVAAFTADPLVTGIDETEVDFENESLFADSYLWDFGDGSPTETVLNPSHLYPEVPEHYTVTLIAYNNAGLCKDTAQIQIIIEDEILLYVPNVFTPDHDDYNETFQPVFTSGFDPLNFHLMIFNRWGELIFESYDASKGWNGTYGGRGLVEDDVYVWKIVFKESMSDKRHTLYGHVTVLK